MRSRLMPGLMILLTATTMAIGQEIDPANLLSEGTLTNDPFGDSKNTNLSLPQKLEASIVNSKVIDYPLAKLIEEWEQTHKVDLTLSPEVLEHNPSLLKVRSNVLIKDAPLSNALTVILKGHGFAWYVDEESVIITTHEMAQSRLTLQTYELKKLDATEVIQQLDDELGTELATMDREEPGYQLLAEQNVLRVWKTFARHQNIAAIIRRARAAYDRAHPPAPIPANDPFWDHFGEGDPFGEPPPQ